jgi:hypothetical protein
VDAVVIPKLSPPQVEATHQTPTLAKTHEEGGVAVAPHPSTTLLVLSIRYAIRLDKMLLIAIIGLIIPISKTTPTTCKHSLPLLKPKQIRPSIPT